MSENDIIVINDESIQVKIDKVLEKLNKYFPEHKVFALDAIDSTLRENVTLLSKQIGYESADKMLLAYGFEKISGEKVKELRNNVIYAPGEEPEIVKNKVENVCKRLKEYYPDRKILRGIENDHKALSRDISGMYQWLGYKNSIEFLKAYGYDYQIGLSGRPKSDLMEVIKILKERYKDGPKFDKIENLVKNNKDLAGNIKTLSNKSQELFGMTLRAYFIQEGILKEIKRVELKPNSTVKEKVSIEDRLNEIVNQLTQRYENSFKDLPKSLNELINKNPDLKIKASVEWIKKQFNMKAAEFYTKKGIIKDTKLTEDKFNEFIDFLKKKHVDNKVYSLNELELQNENIPFGKMNYFVSKKYDMTLCQYLLKENIISKFEYNNHNEYNNYYEYNKHDEYDDDDEYDDEYDEDDEYAYLVNESYIKKLQLMEMVRSLECEYSRYLTYKDLFNGEDNKIWAYYDDTKNVIKMNIKIDDIMDKWNNENVYKGMKLIVDRDIKDNGLSLLNENREELGKISSKIALALVPVLDEENAKIVDAKVSNAEAVSKESVLYVELTIELEDLAKDLHEGSCLIVSGMDWKADAKEDIIIKSSIPIESAKKIFELIEEYDFDDEPYSYILDEIRTNSNKYGELKEYIKEDMKELEECDGMDFLVTLFEKFCIDKKTYHWIDQGEVNSLQWEIFSDFGFFHWGADIYLCKLDECDDYENHHEYSIIASEG